VQSRQAALIRARANVRNVESRLRALVNDPELYGAHIEMVPKETPQCHPLDISVREAMGQALETRPEIDEAIQKVRAAGVRLSVAKNELMPILDLVLETYLSGLRGSNNIGQAWVDQFSVGEPGYSVGFRYEIPIHNRMAKNRHARRRIEMRQAISQFQFQIEELMADVEIGVRDVHASHAEMLSRHQAMAASRIDLEYFSKRWELLPGDDTSASFLLDNILQAQDRLADEESNFAQTQVTYAVAIVRLKQALGILLQSERVETHRVCHNGLGQYRFRKESGMIASGEPQRLSSGVIGTKHAVPAHDSSQLESIPSGVPEQDSGQLTPIDCGLLPSQSPLPRPNG
jgi:outer membrane protein TolC